MKKSLLAAALLFSVDSLAGGCSGYILSPTSKTVYGPSSDWCNTDNSPFDNHWGCPTPYVTQFFYDEYYNKGGSNCGGTRQYYTSVSSCPAGTSKDLNNVCVPPCNGTWNYAYGTCTLPPLSFYDNDPAGCKAAGGYWFNDNTCVTGTEAIQKVFTDPTALIGGLVFINGAAWSIAGAYALPITGGASSAAIAYGGHAMAGGLGMIGVSALGQMWQGSSSPSNDFIASDSPTRIKVSTDQYQATVAASSDTLSGQVKEISYIPPEVKQRILDGVVNPTTGLPNLTNADLAGTVSTKYDYSSNTATTSTMKSDGSIATSTTAFTPVTNSDGTVTAQSHDESIAPTVTGTKSTPAQVPNWNQYQTIAQWTEKAATTAGTTTTGGGSTGGGTTPVSTGDSTADAIVNADMPSYNLGENGTFDRLDGTFVNDMHSSVTGLFDNVQNQIDAARQVYDQTSSLVTDGWQSPQIPSGECGDGLTLDLWGKHLDICPVITQFLAPLSPIITLLVTIAGTAFAIAIFIGGF